MKGLPDLVRETAPERRKVLIDAMRQLAGEGRHCGGCAGTCCTFVANSMQVTPLEALDLLAFLGERGLLGDPLVERLRETVARFGLDRPLPGTGSRALLRRRYTCPFFGGGLLGCGIDPDFKPYGCLAFNPRRSDVTQGEDCGGDGDLLEEQQAASAGRREDPWGTLGVAPPLWDKLPIPLALLALIGEAV